MEHPAYFDPVTVAPRAPGPLPLPSDRRRAGGGTVLVLVLVLVLVVASAVLAQSARARGAALGTVVAVDQPAAAAAGWGATYVDAAGRPGRWDPCQPIHYVVNERSAPVSARADLDEALRRLSAASGLQFVDDGASEEVPARGRASYQPARYGRRWAPLLIAWVSSGSADVGLDGRSVGVSIAAAVPGTAGPHLVSGLVALDAGQPLPSGFGPGTTQGEVLLHELAHAVGLGHVLDATQVMYPQTTHSESVFGAGDRAGLAAVGAAAGCYAAPAAADVG